ncbi:MAG: ROK family protein [Marinomonas sp.]|uniref:ROK family protein n=1 Tax=Alphaproteobacteria TaxID=28211 RepID=UPI0032663A4B
MQGEKLYGLIEAGGTKFVLGIARLQGDIVGGVDASSILETTRIPTTTPAQTITAAIAWFREQSETFGKFDAIGLASFGPLQLDKSAANFGFITDTPKKHWLNTDLLGPFQRAFGCPIAIDTDVNAAALSEYRWGRGRDCRSVVYLTIGTGVGGGAVIGGKMLHGVSHPEMGHMRVQLHESDHGFAGSCAIHGACLEGLASGPAIIKRWGKSLSELPDNHEAKSIIAFYLAQVVCNLQAVLEPDRIILGGGVMATPDLLFLVKAKAAELGGQYFSGNAYDIIASPGLGTNAGLLGALAVAQQAA